MKILMTVFLVTLPAAAQAAGMRGGCNGDYLHVVSALYAVLAALGYWVLQHAGKETADLVRRTGIFLGMTLVLIGLLGLLCGVGSHINKSMARSCVCPEQDMTMRGGPGMMMHGGMKGGMGEMPSGAKVPGPAVKKP